MRRTFVLLLVICVLKPPQAFAEERPLLTIAVPVLPDTASLSQKLILTKAIEREATRWTLSPGRAQSQQPAPQNRSWIGRHPAWFGALVGAGAGAVSSLPRWTELYCATGGDEDCLIHGGAGVLFGIGAGAGIGALVGHLVGK